MFLTKEILKENRACGDGYLAFIRHYPNGAELIDIIQDSSADLDIDFLHWGRKHLDVNGEEIAAYNKRCNIVESYQVFESEKVDHCSFVSKSSNIKQSTHIFSSKKIEDCSQIHESVGCLGSTCTSHSNFVYNSVRVINSNNVTNGVDILHSNFVIDSDGVAYSERVENCKACYDCIDCADVYFSRQMRNCNHCLFCYDLEDKEYYMFNQPISKSFYDVIVKQFDNMYAGMKFTTVGWHDDSLSMFEVPKVVQRYDVHYSKFDNTFYDWAKTLPNFNSLILYNICYNSRCLSM